MQRTPNVPLWRGRPQLKTWQDAPLIAACIVLLSIAGCSNVEFGAADAVPGDEVSFTGSVKFYVRSGFGTYFKIPETAYPLLLAQPIWSTPDGVTLAGVPELDLAPSSISWTIGDIKYTVEGVELTAKGRVKVSDQARPGLETISLELPGIDVAASTLGGTAVFPDGDRKLNSIELDKVMIHPSAGSKWGAKFAKGVALTIFGIVIIAVIGAWLKVRE